MKEYGIQYCAREPDWEAVPPLSAEHILWLADCGIRMEQRICYNREAIYVRQEAVEGTIRVECDGILDSVCQDSCMEFFFMPEGDDRYLNFEWNLCGSLWLGIGRGRDDRVRLLVPNPVKRFDFRGGRTSAGWYLTYRIPRDFLALFYPSWELKPGQSLRANCYKCGDLTEKPHYLSWNPVNATAPDFHRPEDFGKMVLEKQE